MTADQAREEHRRRCVHLFEGECTRNCTSPEQFRPCSGRCPRMRIYNQRIYNEKQYSASNNV